MLRVDVPEQFARQLRRLDLRGRLRYVTSPALAGFVVGEDVAVDAIGDIAKLWRDRLEPYAARLSGEPIPTAPAVLHAPDPTWPTTAEHRINRLRRALASFEGVYDHIGSTSVPGLAAKANIDLQIRMPALPTTADFDDVVYQVGYVPITGSRPDSPGVYRDIPRGNEVVPDEVWNKRLFYSPDPALPSILHIRRADSPFGRHTVQFRDWLRAHPEQAARYQQEKTRLAELHAGDRDYDDYTRAKTRFFDRVQDQFEAATSANGTK